MRFIFLMRCVLVQVGFALVVGMGLVSCAGPQVSVEEEVMSAEVLRAVNHERVKRGLGRVAADRRLQQLASPHGGFLVRHVYPNRGRPSREVAHAHFKKRSAQARRQNYRVLSEVVMVGYAGDLSAVPERTIKGWLTSPSHRRAILNKDRKVMGVETRLPGDGRYFVVGLLSNGRGR